MVCEIFVSARKSLLTEKTSLTPNDHAIHGVANLRGVHAISKYGNMTAVKTALPHKNGRVPIDQSRRTLTDGLDKLIMTVAGTGFSGSNGENILATSSFISAPYGITVDGEGNYYIVENASRVRKVTASTGRITLVAGTGFSGYNGDGILARSAKLDFPKAVDLDGSGNVYIADQFNHRVRKVTVSTGMITTIAGTGSGGCNGDDIVATSAKLFALQDIAFDGSGNVYIADYLNQRVRKVTASTGIITTIAGTGSPGYNGDGILATSAQLNMPTSIAFDGSGNLYIADLINHRVRKVTASTGMITTIAGTGSGGYNGDGIVATSAKLNLARETAVDGSGNVYIADTENHRIRFLMSEAPTASPSTAPSMTPTSSPSAAPSMTPTAVPTVASRSPLCEDTTRPSSAPSSHDCTSQKPKPKSNTWKPSSRAAAPRV